MDLNAKLMRINDKSVATFVMDLKLSENITMTEEGFLKCENSILGRTGFQTYYGSELAGMGFPDEELVKVFRDEADVFHADSLESANGKPVTLDHPDFDVDVHNFKDLARGYIIGTPVRDGDNVIGTIMITDLEAIELVKSKKVRDLSLGYRTKLVKNGDFVKQTQIRINHLALVEYGRAGNSRIVDKKIIEEDKNLGTTKDLLKTALEQSNGNTINIYVGDKKEEVKPDKEVEDKEVKDEKEVIEDKEVVEKDEKEVIEDKEVVEKDEKEKEVVEDKDKKEDKEKKDMDKKVLDNAILEYLKSMTKEEKEALLGVKDTDVIKKENELNDKMFGGVKQVDNTVEDIKVNDYVGLNGDEIHSVLQKELSKFNSRALDKNTVGVDERQRKINLLKSREGSDFVKGGF